MLIYLLINADLSWYQDKIAEQQWVSPLVSSIFVNQRIFIDNEVYCHLNTCGIVLEVINLLCDSHLKSKFVLVNMDPRYKCLLPANPKLTALVSKLLWIFAPTCLCEQAIFVLNIKTNSIPCTHSLARTKISQCKRHVLRTCKLIFIFDVASVVSIKTSFPHCINYITCITEQF